MEFYTLIKEHPLLKGTIKKQQFGWNNFTVCPCHWSKKVSLYVCLWPWLWQNLWSTYRIGCCLSEPLHWSCWLLSVRSLMQIAVLGLCTAHMWALVSMIPRYMLLTSSGLMNVKSAYTDAEFPTFWTQILLPSSGLTWCALTNCANISEVHGTFIFRVKVRKVLNASVYLLSPWRWRQYASLKHRQHCPHPHSAKIGELDQRR
jgi:hypothetical protein